VLKGRGRISAAVHYASGCPKALRMNGCQRRIARRALNSPPFAARHRAPLLWEASSDGKPRQKSGIGGGSGTPARRTISRPHEWRRRRLVSRASPRDIGELVHGISMAAVAQPEAMTQRGGRTVSGGADPGHRDAADGRIGVLAEPDGILVATKARFWSTASWSRVTGQSYVGL